jgi:hydrogenase nickel incorporation protein HypA/HybF
MLAHGGGNTYIESMHELSIAQSIVDIVLQYLPKENGVTVRNVKLRVGEMAGVVPDSLEFCFSAITEGTCLNGAVLQIEHVPLTAHCNNCGRDGEIEPTLFRCSSCGGNSLTVLSGRELQVKEIDVDENEGVP